MKVARTVWSLADPKAANLVWKSAALMVLSLVERKVDQMAAY